jgi:hypothetical protein
MTDAPEQERDTLRARPLIIAVIVAMAVVAASLTAVVLLERPRSHRAAAVAAPALLDGVHQTDLDAASVARVQNESADRALRVYGRVDDAFATIPIDVAKERALHP